MVQKTKILLKKLFKYYAPVFLWCLAIYIVSNRTVPKSSDFFWQDFVIKKLAHIFEYGALSVLVYRAFTGSGIDKKKAGYFAVIFVIIYGMSDEYHQSFVPGRQSTIRDVIFDGFGGGLAIYFIWNILPKSKGRVKYVAKVLEIINAN